MRLITLICLLALSSASLSDETENGAENSKADLPEVIMRKNPGCGCCEVWADHLRSFGFIVTSVPDDRIMAFKAEHKIPRPLMSCHTAMIDGYFVEGHVPANDILRLLKEKPAHVTGIAVPGMPLGSPGMEHSHPQDFRTIALLTDGSAYVFAEHAAGEDFGNQADP